jgi:hypothetical protein
MPRKYQRKKPRRTAPNPWLRRRVENPLDPEEGEPWLADFFRNHIPSFLTISAWVHELGIAKGARISEHEVARGIYNIALVYRQGQGIEQRIAEASDLKLGGKLPAWALSTLKTRGRSHPTRYADLALIIEAKQLLQRMKGHNAKIGWSYWIGIKASGPSKMASKLQKSEGRHESEIQGFVEQILSLIDPYRTDPPAARYYWDVTIGTVT